MRTTIIRILILIITCLCAKLDLPAQQIIGASGLLRSPSADMYPDGTAIIGGNYLNQEVLPATFNYNSGNYFIGVTFLPFMEIEYICTIMKLKDGHINQDRSLSVKFRLLTEKKWYPSIALGGNDVYSFGDAKKNANNYFSNFYIALTKHLYIKKEEIGFHIAYRNFLRPDNALRNGLTGGITYRPHFYTPLQFIAEYASRQINIGADILLFKHISLLAMLQNGKYFSGGISFHFLL